MQLEDDLNIFENGRQPHFFLKRKMTSIFLKKEDDLNVFENGRGPQIFENGRRPYTKTIKPNSSSFYFFNERRPYRKSIATKNN